MKQEELDIILENHGKWLLNEGGERANLSNIDLNGIDLSGSNLERAYLKNTNLTGANLSNVNMQSTYLRGVNFEEACLTGADLSNATLHCTNLRGANLIGANLSNADLNWINWQSIQGLTAVVVQVDTTRRNNQITYIKELGIWTTGCFQGTLEELKDSIEQTHASNDFLKRRYYRAINYILTEADFEEDLEEENNEI
ncbi:TPA: pentapeptide repeat-containing protein [Listeria monocytogenes]|uniref:pentapeptide repeat-containing protein n=2 Tax=Listeria monocytogenes TaxID=1639 RepID=UPI0010E874C9|nr:pentapeptide repeat-containing protein [Listeria monocytogenes]EAG1888209.1 pentapeptide repeat-containing protein [Listeria monocytogenes]EAG8180889.1 pentapeptide repeat-containing protein [Listeria monocytogenes]EGP8670529.1 pentapeptide repeat-containing protein [Listeria monocytogenes]EGP8695653.1 pentapeptide repeat-containing protein [Listeria monocytogenes]